MNPLGKKLVPAPILVVDDDVDLCNLMKKELQNITLVETCQNPLLALKLLQNKDYGAIISDLVMPEMNGLEFLAKCSQIRPHSQRILCTAFVDLVGLEQSINSAHLNYLITKPWNGNDLRAAVQQAQRIHQLQIENETLRKIALTDALTEVANHRYFWERLDSEFSRAVRFQRPLALIIADVDDFKKFNDRFGHLEGDKVLHAVAQALEKGRRSMDLVARYGGEEFAIILPEVTREQACDIARRHLDNCLNKTNISLSLGVAAYPEDANSPTELVFRADQALLLAKRSGKQRVCSAEQIKELA